MYSEYTPCESQKKPLRDNVWPQDQSAKHVFGKQLCPRAQFMGQIESQPNKRTGKFMTGFEKFVEDFQCKC